MAYFLLILFLDLDIARCFTLALNLPYFIKVKEFLKREVVQKKVLLGIREYTKLLEGIVLFSN